MIIVILCVCSKGIRYIHLPTGICSTCTTVDVNVHISNMSSVCVVGIYRHSRSVKSGTHFELHI